MHKLRSEVIGTGLFSNAIALLVMASVVAFAVYRINVHPGTTSSDVTDKPDLPLELDVQTAEDFLKAEELLNDISFDYLNTSELEAIEASLR